MNPTPPDCLSSSDSTSTPSSLIECGTRLEREGHFPAALAAFRAASLCPAFPEGKLAFASFLIRRNEQAEAENLLEQARCELHSEPAETDSSLMETGADSVAQNQAISAVLNNQAGVCRSLGAFAKAAALQQQSLKVQLSISGEATPADLAGAAQDAILRGEFGIAENLLLRSLHQETAAGNQAGIAADCGNLGLLAGLRGQLAVGIRFLGRARQIHLKLKDDLGAGTDFLNLAELFRTAGRWSLAARSLHRAKKHFERAGAPASIRHVNARLKELNKLDEVQSRDPLLN